MVLPTELPQHLTLPHTQNRMYCSLPVLYTLYPHDRTTITSNITNDGERVSSFKFLGVHLAENLTWTLITSHIVMTTQERSGEHPDKLHHCVVRQRHCC